MARSWYGEIMLFSFERLSQLRAFRFVHISRVYMYMCVRICVYYVWELLHPNICIEHEIDFLQTYQLIFLSHNGQCLLAKPFLDHWSWSTLEICYLNWYW